MAGITLNAADVVVLSVLIAVMMLIIRGMLHGTIRTCDPTSCSGNCGSCGQECATPRIKLTRAQLDELDALSRQAKEAQ